MRNALPLLIAGSCLAVLPMLGPAATSMQTEFNPVRACVARGAPPITATRDWLGSLHGWQDSVLVLAWRSTMAAARGKPGPSACAE